jgi:hypothetical protein
MEHAAVGRDGPRRNVEDDPLTAQPRLDLGHQHGVGPAARDVGTRAEQAAPAVSTNRARRPIGDLPDIGDPPLAPIDQQSPQTG